MPQRHTRGRPGRTYSRGVSPVCPAHRCGPVGVGAASTTICLESAATVGFRNARLIEGIRRPAQQARRPLGDPDHARAPDGDRHRDARRRPPSSSGAFYRLRPPQPLMRAASAAPARPRRSRQRRSTSRRQEAGPPPTSRTPTRTRTVARPTRTPTMATAAVRTMTDPTRATPLQATPRIATPTTATQRIATPRIATAFSRSGPHLALVAPSVDVASSARAGRVTGRAAARATRPRS
jgi:hypothetical protein